MNKSSANRISLHSANGDKSSLSGKIDPIPINNMDSTDLVMGKLTFINIVDDLYIYDNKFIFSIKDRNINTAIAYGMAVYFDNPIQLKLIEIDPLILDGIKCLTGKRDPFTVNRQDDDHIIVRAKIINNMVRNAGISNKYWIDAHKKLFDDASKCPGVSNEPWFNNGKKLIDAIERCNAEFCKIKSSSDQKIN